MAVLHSQKVGNAKEPEFQIVVKPLPEKIIMADNTNNDINSIYNNSGSNENALDMPPIV